MRATSVTEVLARANATMVGRDLDVTGALAQLLAGVVEVLPADAAAILVTADDDLELLSATSHRAADLELHQAQVDEGPCLDAVRTGEQVCVVGADDLVRRWPRAGPAIVASGYLTVQATPLRWQGSVFGALNVLRRDAVGLEDHEAECRALADAVTMVVVSGLLCRTQLQESLRNALASRAVVEHAKGALAHALAVHGDDAFDALVDFAATEGMTLGIAAARVMELARTGALADHLRSR